MFCGKNLEDVYVYLCAGGVADLELVDDRLLEAHFHIGVHTQHSDMTGCVDLDVVKELVGGQFDLGFCSTNCLREFLLSMVAELESKVRPSNENRE